MKASTKVYAVYDKFSSGRGTNAPDTISLESQEPIYDSSTKNTSTWTSKSLGWDKEPGHEVRSMTTSGKDTQHSRSLSPLGQGHLGVLPSPDRANWPGSVSSTDHDEDLSRHTQRPEKLEINKETTFAVSASQVPKGSERDLPRAPSQNSLQFPSQTHHRTMPSRDRSAEPKDWRDHSASARGSRRNGRIMDGRGL